ncbi:MAG TPA: CBS domain-containing protein [Methanomicrobia archaeon]|nr:CBS domain-containing protein [Methanomicrobia archaeon]HEX59856.1 CBS domain-containing protein [Methanomicrobia archaeon]
MEVREILTENYESIDAEETISKALSMFKSGDVDVLIVFKDGKYMGILTERIIVRALRDPKTKVKTLAKRAPRISPETSIYEAARLMFEAEVKHLPVFEDGKLIGIVTDEALLLAAVNTEFSSTPVKELMSSDVISVSEDDTLAAVLNTFREHGISRAPVVKDGKLVGIVTMHDCIMTIVPKKRLTRGAISEKKPRLGIPVKNVMTESVITISEDDNVKKAVEMMVNNGISGLVVTKDGEIRGVVTKADILEAISKLGAKERADFFLELTPGGASFDRKHVEKELKRTIEKFGNFLKRGIIHVYFKRYRRTFRGQPLVFCKIRMRTDGKIFIGRGEGFGGDAAFHIALENLERQILKAKELNAESWRLLEKMSLE